METQTLSALARGVKLIGIGKHGSKKLPDELIAEITGELKQRDSPVILIGAFFGALMMKDREPAYFLLEEYSGKGSLTDVSILWEQLFADVPARLKPIGLKLLSKQTLNEKEAKELGLFLFSDEQGECFRGMAASVLRIRYETDDEYKGLYDAIMETSPAPQQVVDEKPIIQLAEPFDGVEHSYLITPLLANEFQKLGYTVVVSCGRTSGPKKTLNTWDIYKSLNADFLTATKKPVATHPEYGWALDQKDFFPALDAWVDKRRIIMKRPFLATLEKVLNPVKANLLITSVFHLPYLEKMLELGFMAGFSAVIVLKRGLEGSLAPSLAKSTGILCGVKLTDGTTLTKTFDAATDAYEAYKAPSDSVIDNLNVTTNVNYIQNFLTHEKTGDADFDLRVRFAVDLYKKGLDWIHQHEKH